MPCGRRKAIDADLLGAQWRPDQKEPPLREAAALRGIRDFFAGMDCIDLLDIRRLAVETTAVGLADADILRLAAASVARADRVVVILVRELGPRISIGLPVLLEGGTEVVIDVRVLDARASESMANFRTHWWNGGTFVIKGVKTLDQDMQAALSRTLIEQAQGRIDQSEPYLK